MLDAIVSIKTFGNATFGHCYFQMLSSNFLCKLCGPFKTFDEVPHVARLNRNEDRAKDE
jgi:hypothetical protein